MKPGTTRFTVETLAAGQSRPYADSIYIYRMTCEQVGHMGDSAKQFNPRDLTADYAKKLAKTICHNFKERSENPDWHEPILERFEQVSPGVWEMQIRTEYTG